MKVVGVPLWLARSELLASSWKSGLKDLVMLRVVLILKGQKQVALNSIGEMLDGVGFVGVSDFK